MILTQFYPPDYAATGQLIAELANHLSELGMKVGIFTGQPGYAFDRDNAPKQERQEGISVQRSRTSRLWPLRIRGRAINGLLFCLRTAMHLLKVQRRYELLLITSEPPYLSILGYLAYRWFGLPYTCLLYDLYPDVAVALNVLPSRHLLVRFWDQINRHIWKSAEKIIVLSPSMKERVVKKCPRIESKIHVIPNWADSRMITPLKKPKNWFARQHRLTERFIVQYSGNLGRCHDLNTILVAAELLRDQPIQFLFIARGAQLDACQERVERANLKNCRFLPYQDKEVLPYSLTACDLSLVSISPGLEGLVAPSKLYGILAAGRPVAAVCAPHSYLRDVLAEAKCGRAFDNGDGEGLANYIYKLSQYPHYAESMGLSGRQYLQTHFTPEIVAKTYYEVLNG
ncbi:glycosyltransferase family 4 protein [Spirulina sp. CS-785/01]|uniref:glycosyltransferase family 4 protein n=1 Tax=Spirulina sp. CS-785/01 TaxID=3021716 RepID=UPI002330CA81|nr:glycosyltransferase family 4 protein [Spirulina sp. CS-785/01]MDB9314783.1 glycosyltransferase family 4 protein [Spirulina sp. CS-785/01]